MTLHNYRSRQVHETLNGVNPSSSFRDMHSAKSGPNLWQIWQVFGPWASPYGANGHMTLTVHTYKPRQFHRTSNGESNGYRDMGSTSLAVARPPAHPPARTVTTIPLQPGGLRGKKLLRKEKGWLTDVGHNLWWHMKCPQYAAHNTQIRKDGIIQTSPVVAIKNWRTHPHGWRWPPT